MKVSILLSLLLVTTMASAQSPFIGNWLVQVSNEAGSEFHLKIKADYSVESSIIRSSNRYLVETGYWRKRGKEVHVYYNTGYTDVLSIKNNVLSRLTYKPGDKVSKGKGIKTTGLKEVESSIWRPIPEEQFVGYWKLMDEKGEVFYLNTRYDHEAQSTYADGINGVFGEIGIWKHEENRIVISYNSGWVDIITYVQGEYKKASYAPEQRMYTMPNNFSKAEKIEKLPIGRS